MGFRGNEVIVDLEPRQFGKERLYYQATVVAHTANGNFNTSVPTIKARSSKKAYELAVAAWKKARKDETE